MNCFWCRADAGRTSKDTKAILCGNCVQKLTGAPEIKPPAPKLSVEEKQERKAAKVAKKAAKLEKMKTASRGRGRGWHLKKLFEFNGEFFSMGKPISPLEAAKIRKQLAKEPTPIVTTPKKRGRPRKV